MTPERRKFIREAYEFIMPEIMVNNGFNPYRFTDWVHDFSPIEDNAWYAIRYLGLRLYPQFPVLGYFIDFADPINKIAVELDGKEWHKDKEKDLKRQQEIENLGWRFIRIKGKDTFKCKILEEEENYYNEDREKEEVICECCECILRKLKYELQSASIL